MLPATQNGNSAAMPAPAIPEFRLAIIRSIIRNTVIGNIKLTK
jgi:hypothetical protein